MFSTLVQIFSLEQSQRQRKTSITLEFDVMHLDQLTPYNVIPLVNDYWYLYKESALVYEGQSDIPLVNDYCYLYKETAIVYEGLSDIHNMLLIVW